VCTKEQGGCRPEFEQTPPVGNELVKPLFHQLDLYASGRLYYNL
jgi:hypothetical protein